MVECKDLFQRMSEYLDGEMDVAAIEMAMGHLAHCLECKDILEAFKRSVVLLKRAESQTLPEMERRRLKAMIDEEVRKLSS